MSLRPQNTPWRRVKCNNSANIGATTKVKLSTDRACIGDEFRALKQVLGRSRSRVMPKSVIFCQNRDPNSDPLLRTHMG